MRNTDGTSELVRDTVVDILAGAAAGGSLVGLYYLAGCVPVYLFLCVPAAFIIAPFGAFVGASAALVAGLFVRGWRITAGVALVAGLLAAIYGPRVDFYDVWPRVLLGVLAFRGLVLLVYIALRHRQAAQQ